MVDSKGRALNEARLKKDDEFYTQYKDIAAEVEHYKKHFAGKVVYCNCDDPEWSNFVRYFQDNYKRLGLAGLLTNHLQADGSGDFRGKDALAKLEQADIVVSNPPFSLSRQYIAQLIDVGRSAPLIADLEPPRDKSFLVVGNLNQISNKDMFPLIKAGKLWVGVESIDYFISNGALKQVSACWITNLKHGQQRPLDLTALYDPVAHPRYENYDAIDVGKVKDIPVDYAGDIGVPITILMGYNLEQFDIIRVISDGITLRVADGIKKQKNEYDRVIIRRRDIR